MTAPAVVAAIPLAVGAALGVMASPVLDLRPWLVLGSVGVAVAAWRGDRRVVVGLLLLCFLLAGWHLGSRSRADALETPLARWFASQPGARVGRVGPVRIVGRLRRDATEGLFGTVVELESERVGVAGGDVRVAGGVRLSVGGRLTVERSDAWRAGRRLALTATVRSPSAYLNPGLDDQAEAQALGGTVLVGSVKSALLVEILGHGSVAAELAARLRGGIRRVIGRAVGTHGVRSAAIVTAVLIGDRAGLDSETTRRLQESGTYHVIAISGGNIAIFALCLHGLGRALGARPRVLSLVVMCVLLGYAYVVGREPSVARATAAAVLFLAGGLLDHRPPALNLLAVTAFGIVLVAPPAVTEAGFLLTFGATLGIVLGASPLADLLCRRLVSDTPAPVWVRAPVTLLAATVCAEAVLLPVGASVFGRVSLAGLGLNFLAIPLMTATQLAGMATLGLAAVNVRLAEAAGYVAHLAATGLVRSAALVEWMPALVFRVPPPPPVGLVVYYLALVALLCRVGPPGARRASCGVLLAVTGWFLVGAPGVVPALGTLPQGSIRVTFLDVGQADATLLQTADGRSMLIDAGGGLTTPSRIGERVVVPALWAAGVRRLDVAVVTHGDPDHIGGMADVVRDLRPREVWDGVPVPGHAALEQLRGQAAADGVPWRQVATGQRLELGAVSVDVAHPPPPDWERVRVRNDDSVVLDLRYGEVSVLLPGDIGVAVEPAVLAALDPAPWRVVKMPHHGSAGSSGSAFVTGTRPCLAVASAGRSNAFGHPAADVVGRYREAGALVLDTGHGGAVILETDGYRVRVRRGDGGITWRTRSSDGCR